MEAADHEVQLKAYLSAAFAEQAARIPGWESENPERVAEEENMAIAYRVYLDEQIELGNQAIGAAIQAEKKQESYDRGQSIQVLNDSGSSVWIEHGGTGVRDEVQAGSELFVGCNGPTVRLVTSSGDAVRDLFGPQSVTCGSQVSLSSY